MKVVLKRAVFDRIKEDIYKAKREHREVDYVAVTPPEYAELSRDPRSIGYLEGNFSHCFRLDAQMDASAVMHVRTFEFTGTTEAHHAACRGRYLQVPAEGTFMGNRLFVVPEEYMPR